MENIGFLIFLLVMWAIGQAMRARENRRGGQDRRRGRAQQRPQARRPPETARRTAEAEITLEEWMERVRQGQLPQSQRQSHQRPQPQPRQREPVPPRRDPEAILRDWQQRTGEAQRARRRTPVRTPPPTVRREKDAYAERQERLRRAEQQQRAQQRALALEQEREQRALEQREAERRMPRARQRTPAATRIPPVAEEVSPPVRRPVAPARVRLGLLPSGHDVYAHRARRKRRIGTLDLSRTGLRNGILLAEILGPPVALRPPQAPGRFTRVGAVV